MPETQEIVINTGPLIALVAGLEDLNILLVGIDVSAIDEICTTNHGV